MSSGNNDHAQRMYKYGLTRLQYLKMLQDQDGKCAGCGKGETTLGKHGEARALSVDHCHETGIVRGLLCNACNHAIAKTGDSPALLRRLAAYLEVSAVQVDARKLCAETILDELAAKEN